MASNKLEVSDFDFDNIKSNLKTFLQSQPEFSDYNFEGSGFAVLLDILAYNTHYLGFNANMLVNEMYLDSADIRKNIVSIAKMLGYTPSSVRSPTASISVQINDATGSTLTLPMGTVFSTLISGTSYQFLTLQDYTITPTNGVYLFSNVDIYEGTLVTFRYVVDSTDPDQKFIIPSSNADISTLSVAVQNSSTDTTTNIFNLLDIVVENDTIHPQVSGGSNVFLIQEGDEGKFEVYFGDGTIGRKLDDGNIVILKYVVTNNIGANGASIFNLTNSIEGFSDFTVITNSAAQGGSLAESKESIRFNAPLFYNAQNRAVTTSDYEVLTRDIYPNALAVRAWGGEEDENPVYGTVKIAIKAASGSTLTTKTKADIVKGLKPYNVASVRPIIVDPEITYILLTSNVKFDSRLTSKSSDTLQSDIISLISNYNDTTLQRFDGIFRYSKIVNLIDSTDKSILGNITKLKIKKTFKPTINTSAKYNIYFRNSLFNPVTGYNSVNGGILESSGFKINGDTTNVYYLDDDGNGNIRRYRISGTGLRSYVNNTQGKIYYSTGEIILNSLNITNIQDIRGEASEVIEIIVKPKSNDIIPVRDQIIEIDIANSNITAEIDNFVNGTSNSETGYNTTSSY